EDRIPVDANGARQVPAAGKPIARPETAAPDVRGQCPRDLQEGRQRGAAVDLDVEAPLPSHRAILRPVLRSHRLRGRLQAAVWKSASSKARRDEGAVAPPILAARKLTAS